MWENHAHEWDLLAQGKAEGIAEGRAKMEASFKREKERLDKLIAILKEKGEVSLALDAVQDLELREKLYLECGIN